MAIVLNQNLIKVEYFNLIALLEFESKNNSSIRELFNYVIQRKSKFTNPLVKLESKEVIRGINRYSDEFSFSKEGNEKIKESLSKIYDLLNC